MNEQVVARLFRTRVRGELAAPKGMTAQEAQAFLEKHDVRYVLAQFVDIHGVPKTKAVPAEHLDMILTEGAGFAGFAIWGMAMEPHDPDFMAIGDLDTLTLLPWMPGYARIVCRGHVRGKPYPYDTRNILLAQVARLAERGWTMNTGLEPEFMLLKQGVNGRLQPVDDTDTQPKAAYDYKGLNRSRGFLERLSETLRAVGMDVYQIDHEDANGQFEINYRYADAVTSADHITFVKMAANEVANEMGIICTFMPKPMSHATGNGMHIHLSIADAAGRNLFQDDDDRNGLGLSELAYHFCGGLLHHAGALAALLAPTVNSYKRLVVGRTLSGASWAPAYICYGDNNRTSMVRVPYGRLELRLGDSMNPYLGTAAMIAAGLDGVDRRLHPGPPRNANFYKYSPEDLRREGISLLPQSLSEALVALENDALFAEQLGRGFVEEFITLKRMEWVEYHRHVSDWEVAQYLQFF